MDRIVEDVLERGLVLRLRFDRLRPVAAPEDVILAPVPLVEGAGVAAVQVAHSLVQVGSRRFQDKVVVVPHQAADVDPPAVSAFDAPEEMEEHHPVLAVDDDRCLVVPAAPDVVVAAGDEVAVGTPHRPTVASPRSRLARRAPFEPPSARPSHVPGTRLGRTEHRPDGRVSPGRLGLTKPRLWSARDAGATGNSRALGGACAGTASLCVSWRGIARRLRRARRIRSAPR